MVYRANFCLQSQCVHHQSFAYGRRAIDVGLSVLAELMQWFQRVKVSLRSEMHALLRS